MTESSQRFRKVPGRWRGIVNSASLWDGGDYLFSVKSDRFREHYKRFYFRDIQAIVITKAPRFVISTPALGLALFLIVIIVYAQVQFPQAAFWFWLAGILAATTWLYVCATASCICRLYTAVSSEDLPSLYRLRTARKALAMLEQRIAAAQGVFAESWVEAAESRPLGPWMGPELSPLPPSGDQAPSRPPAASDRTLASDLFVASLLADGLLVFWETSHHSGLLADLSMGCTVLQLAAGIWIFVQYQRRRLRAAMPRLALVALLFIGALTYLQVFTDAFAAGVAASRARRPTTVLAHLPSGSVRSIYSGGILLLGIAGLVLSFRSTETI